jgi:periplasmic protein TonB
MNFIPSRHTWLRITATGLLVAYLAGCASPPAGPAPSGPQRSPEAPYVAPGSVASPMYENSSGRMSGASNPRDYRRDAANHLYGQNTNRIFKGRMPPLLYAIGVLQVDVDGRGRVTATRWMRAPSHAPEVMAEIERTVRQAAPYPAPARMGHVTYTDTWLWHKSGQFQLDTLTEGQD